MIYLEGIGVWGPGMAGWQDFRARLAKAGGDYDYAEPPAAALPPRERRRSIASVRLAVEVAGQACAAAGRDAAQYATVFSSSAGDLETLNAICMTLADDARLLSPTRFHNSVHNAPAGYWGIVSGCPRPSNSLAAGADSFAAGLLEAAVQCTVEDTPVMLVAYDLPGPVPVGKFCRIEAAFGVALAFSPAASGSAPTLGVRYDGTAAAEPAMADAGLEALRLGNPSARCLPLLAAIAAGRGSVRLNAGAGSVAVEVIDSTM